jgi:hypothetical protein
MPLRIGPAAAVTRTGAVRRGCRDRLIRVRSRRRLRAWDWY